MCVLSRAYCHVLAIAHGMPNSLQKKIIVVSAYYVTGYVERLIWYDRMVRILQLYSIAPAASSQNGTFFQPPFKGRSYASPPS